MTATVRLDKFGRLVLPKSIRVRLHRAAGTKLKAEIIGDKFVLSREAPSVKIVTKKDGLPFSRDGRRLWRSKRCAKCEWRNASARTEGRGKRLIEILSA